MQITTSFNEKLLDILNPQPNMYTLKFESSEISIHLDERSQRKVLASLLNIVDDDLEETK